MNYNKKIIIALGIFFSTVLISMSIIHIALNFMYPGNQLAESIKENFKDSFGKSIKFDSMIFRYNGDIILHNFYLSNTTDFNDNVNLIKCSEVVIDTYLLDLLREKITFSAVIMYEPEINIIKNYGKSYTDTFITDIVAGFKNDKINQFITKRFSIVLTDSQLFYREIFKKSKTSVDFFDVDIDILYNGDELEYEIDGSIVNNNISRWRSCGFDVEGEVTFNEAKSRNRVKFSNIDISIVNNFLAEIYNDPVVLKGELSGDLSFNTDKENIDIRAEIDACDIYASGSDSSSGFFLKDESIKFEFDITALSTLERMKINKFKIDDDILAIELKSEYVKGEQLSLAIHSNKIDLSLLSGKFIPFKHATYEGDFFFNGSFKFNLKDMVPEDLGLDVKLNGFSITPSEISDNKLKIIKQCNALVAADKEKLLLKSKFNLGDTDVDITFNSQISGWNPFVSKNQVEILSKKMELALLRQAVMAGIDSIYNMAYVDMFQNFDEQRNFLKEPEGIFINNNDLNLTVKAEKLLIVNGAAFDDFNINFKLEKGFLKTELFSLQGYEGVFSLDVYAAFRQEYPFIKIAGGVENLNIAKMSVDSDSAIQAAGILTSDFKFETNAFRVGQIVENGRAAFNISIKDGYFSKTENINKLDNFIKDSGYIQSLPQILPFNSFTFTFMQSANEYYIKNFSMTGNKCSFSAYGKFTEEDGLNVPLNLNINSDNTFTKIPLLISGNLRSPCVKINEKKKQDYICFK